MRAMSLTQPWCGLVASGLKPDENRTRTFIKREDFGKPFALHATGEIDESIYDRIEQIDPSLRLIPEFMTSTSMAARPAPTWYRLSRITSAIIGVAEIERCAVILQGWLFDRYTRERICPVGHRRFAFGPVVYMLRNARALPEPVPCPGKQGFWRLSKELTARVVGQLE